MSVTSYVPPAPKLAGLLPEEIDDLKCMLLTLRETLWWMALKADLDVEHEMAHAADDAVGRCIGRIAILEARLR